MFCPSLPLQFFREALSGLSKPICFVDNSQLIDNVVVESIEHDEENATTGREAKQAMFGEAVRFKFAVFERTYLVLIFLGVTV